MTRYVPIIHWLPRYHRRWWRGDIIAGLSVWALTVTHALTYAGIIRPSGANWAVRSSGRTYLVRCLR